MTLLNWKSIPETEIRRLKFIGCEIIYREACALAASAPHRIDVEFLLNRFKEKSFARGASREQMASCEELGLSLEEFLDVSLGAMQNISAELGL